MLIFPVCQSKVETVWLHICAFMVYMLVLVYKYVFSLQGLVVLNCIFSSKRTIKYTGKTMKKNLGCSFGSMLYVVLCAFIGCAMGANCRTTIQSYLTPLFSFVVSKSLICVTVYF